MRRTLMVAVCFVLAGLAAQMASAGMIAGQFVPDALLNSPGAQYRLIFVTAGATQGDKTLESFYDSFVQGEAALSPLLNTFNYGWEAVVTVGGSVPTYDARTVLAGAAPVYNLASRKVSKTIGVNNDSMLQGSLDNWVQYDQYAGDSGFSLVWTGGLQPVMITPLIQPWLGASDGNSMVGKAFASDGSWLEAFEFSHYIAPNVPFGASVYGISDVLTVPVPEPSAIVLWSLCTGVVGLVCWRKRWARK